MNSSKLKLLLIALFLCANLFFAIRLTDLIESKKYFTEDEINNAVNVLKTKGIVIDSDTVIKEKNVPVTLKLNFNNSTVEKMAKNIMHSEYGSFNIPSGNNFANDLESFTVYNDYNFLYERFEHLQTKDGVIDALKNAKSIDKDLQEELTEKLHDYLTAASSKNIKTTVKIKKHTRKDGLDYIEAQECINGYEINDALFYMVLSGNKTIFAFGKFYFSDTASEFTTEAHDSIDILFETDKTDSKIIDMSLVYFPVYESTTSYYLTPSYKFVYNDGNFSVYDATSGVKRK